MKKALTRSMLVAGGAAVLLASFGTGSALADNEYVGMTYADAANAIAEGGGRPIIATRFGDTAKVGSVNGCTVVGSRAGNFLDSSGQNAGGTVLLNLNCNYPFALPGVAGNSHASPSGKAAYDAALQQAQEQAEQAQAEQEAAAQAAAGG